VIHALVCDDEPAVRFAIEEVLVSRGLAVTAVADAAAALAALDGVDVVVTDLAMPGMDGLALLAAVRAQAPGLPVVVVTARGSERAAVTAMKAGADDYLTKPFDVDELALAVERAAEAGRLRKAARYHAAERQLGQPLLGDSPPMRALTATIERLAGRDVTVLVRGETGTGKELVAAALHALSPRARGPMIAINCAAIPAELAEAELFGHARGAFTGAVAARPGSSRRPRAGPCSSTRSLSCRWRCRPGSCGCSRPARSGRLGENQARPIDVRVMGASHQDLRAAVAAGRFRADLLFRLGVARVEVPPLRARPATPRSSARRWPPPPARFGLDAVILDDALVAALAARPWPGNVRELDNVVTRLVALSDGGRLGLDELQRAAPAPTASSGSGPFRDRVDAFERELIAAALREAGDNRAAAARALGLSRVTLLDRMKRLGLG
jgi:DNA-binding NtrC family response regulator